MSSDRPVAHASLTWVHSAFFFSFLFLLSAAVTCHPDCLDAFLILFFFFLFPFLFFLFFVSLLHLAESESTCIIDLVYPTEQFGFFIYSKRFI